MAWERVKQLNIGRTKPFSHNSSGSKGGLKHQWASLQLLYKTRAVFVNKSLSSNGPFCYVISGISVRRDWDFQILTTVLSYFYTGPFGKTCNALIFLYRSHEF